jgi:hypothetical protein
VVGSDLPGAPDLCNLQVTCGETPLFPRSEEPATVHCHLDGEGNLVTLGSFSRTAVRVRGTSHALRVDDGPLGTWSLLLERPDV